MMGGGDDLSASFHLSPLDFSARLLRYTLDDVTGEAELPGEVELNLTPTLQNSPRSPLAKTR
jgi:hypothetical protein